MILKVLASNICVSDQHMVRGRTTAPEGLALGHEITGEVVERGPNVETIDARSFGRESVDVSRGDVAEQIAQILGEPEAEAAVDAVGFEARAHGPDAPEAPATVLNSLMGITRAGGALGIPGLYVTDDPGRIDDDARSGTLKVRLGLGWAKSHRFTTGQCPVMQYHRSLMAILHERVHIAKAVNATVIGIEDAPRGYAEFDQGAGRKYVLNPYGPWTAYGPSDVSKGATRAWPPFPACYS